MSIEQGISPQVSCKAEQGAWFTKSTDEDSCLTSLFRAELIACWLEGKKEKYNFQISA